MAAPDASHYEVDARSTDIFGRVLCSAREHHFVIDGPRKNGCPGEELNPIEAFLAGVASCGVELVQVIARERGIEPSGVRASIRGTREPDRPAHPEYALFSAVRLAFRLEGVDRDEGEALVKTFKGR